MTSPPDESRPPIPSGQEAKSSTRPARREGSEPEGGTDTPWPYAGQDIDRRARLGAPSMTHGYGHDGGREYRWNALGYRGPEFDPRAAHRVYAFGESHAFGYFVDAEQSWPARFATRWAEERGLAPDEVSFQNFAEVGASNIHIARSVLSQCAVAPPDLVLVHFGEHRRGEVFLGGRPHRIGPWLLEPATAQAAPPEGPLRDLYFQQIERGRGFYEFATGGAPDLMAEFSLERDATCLEQTLRQILLVQYFCHSRGFDAIATCDRSDLLFHDDVRRDPHLGPLLHQIDPDFLDPLRIWDVDGAKADDDGHVDAVRHARFAEAIFDRYRSRGKKRGKEKVSAGVSKALTGERVRGFYEQQPFNFWHSAQEAAKRVEEPVALAAYPDLEDLLDSGAVKRAIDCGCGGGWLSATLALHYGLDVTGIDFSPRSIERARSLAAELDLTERVRFIERDLLAFEPEDVGRPVELAISLGVLHHTADPRGAFDRIAAAVRPGGHFYLGLYHGPGRDPFLRHFRHLALTAGEEAAFNAFCALEGAWHGDEEHAKSWFRDQVLHPHESRHTLREIMPWLEDAGFKLESTSLNRFQPFENLDELFAQEDGYAERSRQALDEGRFFPGFFTALARRV